jgi:hypothetical protein
MVDLEMSSGAQGEARCVEQGRGGECGHPVRRRQLHEHEQAHGYESPGRHPVVCGFTEWQGCARIKDECMGSTLQTQFSTVQLEHGLSGNQRLDLNIFQSFKCVKSTWYPQVTAYNSIHSRPKETIAPTRHGGTPTPKRPPNALIPRRYQHVQIG